MSTSMKQYRRSAPLAGAIVGVAAVAAIGTRAYAQTSETLGSSFMLDSAYNAGETVGGTGTAPTQGYTEGDSDGIIDSFTPTTLNPGDSLTFSGTVTLPSALTGGVQYRIGLFNTNGNNPATTSTGYLGYVLELPNATDGAGAVLARSGTSGNDFSGTGATAVADTSSTSPGTNAPGTPTSENFTLTVTYLGPTQGTTISDSFVSNDGPPATYTQSIVATDAAGADSSSTNDFYNELGFFCGGSTFGGSFTSGTVDYSNLAVTYTPASTVPEPLSLSALGLGGMMLVGRRPRRR